jgi:citrate lyase subunit beta / citryl-CoA lyase
MQPRSWLFAPGHNEKLLGKVFDAGADVVLLDLEDAVPIQLKKQARAMVAAAANEKSCWVRINRPRTEEAERDIAGLLGKVKGFRVPKVESAADVAWVAERAPGVPLDCTIESATGVLAAVEIAGAPACSALAYGGVDLALDLNIADGELETLFVRSSMVIAARAAGKPAPSDGIYTSIYDDDGLAKAAMAARRLGFFGKSAIHPRQVPIINRVFTASGAEIEWAQRVLAAFESAGGAATRLPDGEFVDAPVAERARRTLNRAPQ